MNSIIIIRDTDSNFKGSFPNIKIANSHIHLHTQDIENGIEEFNKLKVPSEIFLVEGTLSNPIYHKLGEKKLVKEENKKRFLTTSTENNKLLNANNKIIEGDEEVDLFI